MANQSTYTIAAGSGDTNKQVLDKLVADMALLFSTTADTSAPSSPSNGQIYIDDSTASRLIVYLRQNGAWVPMIGAHILEASLDCDGNELKNLLIEKLATGSLPTPGASTEAQIAWDETLERVFWAGSTTGRYAAECNDDGSTYVRIPVSMNVATLGTPATEDAATVHGGWTLNQATEELNIIATEPVPAGWTAVPAANKDIVLEVECLLLAVETNGDDIDMDGTYESMSAGQAPGDDTLGFAAVTKDIGTDSGQYDRHIVSLTIDHDGLVADVAAGDTLRATINHNTAGQVAGVIVTGAWFRVPVANFDS